MIYKLVVPGGVEDVVEVRILEWHGQIGTTFSIDQMVVELETHKAIVEVRAGQAGVLRSILCEAGDWQNVGEPVAVFSDEPGEPIPATQNELASWPVDFEIT